MWSIHEGTPSQLKTHSPFFTDPQKDSARSYLVRTNTSPYHAMPYITSSLINSLHHCFLILSFIDSRLAETLPILSGRTGLLPTRHSRAVLLPATATFIPQRAANGSTTASAAATARYQELLPGLALLEEWGSRTEHRWSGRCEMRRPLARMLPRRCQWDGKERQLDLIMLSDSPCCPCVTSQELQHAAAMASAQMMHEAPNAALTQIEIAPGQKGLLPLHESAPPIMVGIALCGCGNLICIVSVVAQGRYPRST